MNTEAWIGFGTAIVSAVAGIIVAWIKQRKITDYKRLEQHLIDIWHAAESIGYKCRDIYANEADHVILSHRMAEAAHAIQMTAYNGLKSLGAVHRDAYWNSKPEIQRKAPSKE